MACKGLCGYLDGVCHPVIVLLAHDHNIRADCLIQQGLHADRAAAIATPDAVAPAQSARQISVRFTTYLCGAGRACGGSLAHGAKSSAGERAPLGPSPGAEAPESAHKHDPRPICTAHAQLPTPNSGHAPNHPRGLRGQCRRRLGRPWQLRGQWRRRPTRLWRRLQRDRPPLQAAYRRPPPRLYPPPPPIMVGIYSLYML